MGKLTKKKINERMLQKLGIGQDAETGIPKVLEFLQSRRMNRLGRSAPMGQPLSEQPVQSPPAPKQDRIPFTRP